MVNDEYIVAGDGDIALNTTHPSPLEENHMIYNLYLTSDLLPHTEELILSGPITDKIHVQVGGKRLHHHVWFVGFSVSYCKSCKMWGFVMYINKSF